MLIYIGADHRGFKLKEPLKNFLKGKGYSVIDVGNNQYDESDDYPDFASKVAEKVSLDPLTNRGVLICGGANGINIAANKFVNVRAVVALTPDQAYDGRNDLDANVISIAADYLEPEAAEKILATWLSTPFSGEERHKRRIQKVGKMELKLAASN